MNQRKKRERETNILLSAETIGSLQKQNIIRRKYLNDGWTEIKDN